MVCEHWRYVMVTLTHQRWPQIGMNERLCRIGSGLFLYDVDHSDCLKRSVLYDWVVECQGVDYWWKSAWKKQWPVCPVSVNKVVRYIQAHSIAYRIICLIPHVRISNSWSVRLALYAVCPNAVLYFSHYVSESSNHHPVVPLLHKTFYNGVSIFVISFPLAVATGERIRFFQVLIRLPSKT